MTMYDQNYLDASKLVRRAALSLADVPGEAGTVQRLHAISQDIFESIPVPDIELPTLDGPSMGVPTAVLVNLDGLGYQLVNWHDYRGWEVRRWTKERENSDPQPRVLGYLTTQLNGADSGDSTYSVRTRVGTRSARDFARIDIALRKLVSW